MGYPFRDDCPSEYSLFRRDFIVGSGVLMGFALLPGAVAASASSDSAVPAAKFMDISSLLINHTLNPDVGDRLAAAMSKAYPGIERDIDEILTIARNKNAKIVEDFFPDIPEGKLRDTALAIISAWYSGVISEAPGAEVFAFEFALMYQPTRDVMTIPTYAISRPNGWSAVAPALADMPQF